ncbi:MAG: hypothetical protein EOO53_02600 [Gammaproteobacteria bacterium]|nr:MAG: hypothetical protein EOO53_02600 [Gammaproteobacteria bacterium]
MQKALLKYLSLISAVVLAMQVQAADVIYKSTDNFYSSGVTASEGSVQHFDESGARIIFTVSTPAQGNYTVGLKYKNTGKSKNLFKVLVNGLPVNDISLSPSGDKQWKNALQKMALRSGLNTIIYESTSNTADAVAIESLRVAGGLALSARGATLPYQEFEAEAGTTNAQISNYDTTYLTPEAESSGRKFVSLNTQGHFVEWVAPKKANSLVVRYSIPDSANGEGTTATLNLYVNNVKVKALNLSSRFAWVYGEYPFNDKVSDGQGHRFYDEIHIAELNIPAGAKVKLQKDADNTAAFYKIDLVNFEQIDSAYSMPKNFVSIVDYGGTANDTTDDTLAFTKAIADAKLKQKGLWIPAGVFILSNPELIELGDVHIRGAGMWYTVLQTLHGKGGMTGKGVGKVTIADLSIWGEKTFRNDQEDAAFGGDFGKGSLFQNVWIEHMKVGFWLSGGDGVFIVNGRIRDTWADGINFAGGVKNSQISHFNFRNTGDDAMAMWSTGSTNVNNNFRFNTVQNPILANAFAIYGGQDNKIFDNIGSDTVFAPAGIAISNRFKPFSFAGVTEVRRNTLNRTGGVEPTYHYNIGAVWIFADESPIDAPIVIDSLDINDSPVDGIFVSQNLKVANLTLNNIHIKNAERYGINLNVTGAGVFTNLIVENAKSGGLINKNSGFDITRGVGNLGW